MELALKLRFTVEAAVVDEVFAVFGRRGYAQVPWQLHCAVLQPITGLSSQTWFPGGSQGLRAAPGGQGRGQWGSLVSPPRQIHPCLAWLWALGTCFSEQRWIFSELSSSSTAAVPVWGTWHPCQVWNLQHLLFPVFAFLFSVCTSIN